MPHILLIPIITVIIAQAAKLALDARRAKFSWSDLNRYGGMPSSHTAFVVALTAAVGYYHGIATAAFAISAVFSILIIRDAAGFRRELGRQAKTINRQLEQLPPAVRSKFELLNERIGHEPREILGGLLIGLLIPLIYILLV